MTTKQDLFHDLYVAVSGLKRDVREMLDVRNCPDPYALLEASEAADRKIADFFVEVCVPIMVINPSLLNEFWGVFEIRYNRYRDSHKALMAQYRVDCSDALPREYAGRSLESLVEEMRSLEAEVGAVAERGADQDEIDAIDERLGTLVVLRAVLERYSTLRERWVDVKNRAIWEEVQWQP